MAFLYKITNKVTGKCYIGVSKDPYRRFKEHTSEHSTCTKLKRSMQKHGSDNFTLSVLCEGSESYVIELEAKAIEVYDSIISGYNILPAHHSDRLTVPREVVEKQKASVRRYYENNVSKNLGRSVEKRVDDKPLYVLGFLVPQFTNS